MAGSKNKLNFNQAELTQGLDIVSTLIREAANKRGSPPALQNLPVYLYIACGATSVMRLQSRPTTEDVDFLVQEDDVAVFLRRAATTVSIRLEWGNSHWLNDDVRFFANHVPRFSYNDAWDQGTCIYASDELVLLSAPWRWQIIKKLMRMTENLAFEIDRPVDLSDAVRFLLEEATHTTGITRLPTSAQILSWFPEVEDRIDRGILQDVLDKAAQQADRAQPARRDDEEVVDVDVDVLAGI